MEAARKLRAARPSRRLFAVLAALALAFVALAALVAAGTLTSLDQLAVSHAMPWFRPTGPSGSTYQGLFLPFFLGTTSWEKALDILTYPCSVLVSGIVVAAVFGVLRGRGRPVAGIAWASAWLAGNALEVAGKHLISRPGLHATAGGVRSSFDVFEQSFPSGHTIRCAIVVGAVVFVWRRAAGPVIAWASLVPFALVLSAAHTPTDVLGGGLVGLILALLAWAISESDTSTTGRSVPGPWRRGATAR